MSQKEDMFIYPGFKVVIFRGFLWKMKKYACMDMPWRIEQKYLLVSWDWQKKHSNTMFW